MIEHDRTPPEHVMAQTICLQVFHLSWNSLTSQLFDSAKVKAETLSLVTSSRLIGYSNRMVTASVYLPSMAIMRAVIPWVDLTLGSAPESRILLRISTGDLSETEIHVGHEKLGRPSIYVPVCLFRTCPVNRIVDNNEKIFRNAM